jgi:hypothetical protein
VAISNPPYSEGFVLESAVAALKAFLVQQPSLPAVTVSTSFSGLRLN